jgi:hypothetical protein
VYAGFDGDDNPTGGKEREPINLSFYTSELHNTKFIFEF